jgi:hypothetical protein
VAEEDQGRLFLVALLLTTLALGGFVLVFKSDYRFEPIIQSNEEYYPHIKLTDDQD